MEEASKKAGGWLEDANFGWRAKIGLITPSRGWTPEHEWPRLLPTGVSYFVSRMLMRATTPSELDSMSTYAFDAAETLASAEVDVICYGCTAQTFLHGLEYDQALEHKLSEATQRPCKTMAGAVIEALNGVDCKRLAIVTPYIKEINERQVSFFESAGFDVVYEKGLGISEPTSIAALTPESVIALGKEAHERAPSADALLISCGNLRTVEAIPELEDAIGKPVISSNVAMVWSALRLAGVHEPVQNRGSLLSRANMRTSAGGSIMKTG
jgi:maleate cis-trans isomerase